MRSRSNDYDWIWLVTNQPKECTMQLNPYFLFNRQCEAAFKFKDRRLIRFEFLQQKTVLYEEL
jgi:hypothetical protein